jgi:hypothetical protein
MDFEKKMATNYRDKRGPSAATLEKHLNINMVLDLLKKGAQA